MTFREIILNSNSVYHRSCDADALLTEINNLTDLLENPALNDNNRMDAEALLYCIKAKLYVIEYMSSDYSESKFKEIDTELENGLKALQGKEYTNTIRIYTELSRTLKNINSFMSNSVEQVYRVRDSEGNPATSSFLILQEVYDDFLIKKEKSETLISTTEIFGSGNMNMISFTEQVREDIYEVCSWLEKTVFSLRTRELEGIFKNNVREFKVITGFQYAPQLRSDGVSAKTVVLCSPFDTEIELFVSSYSQSFGVSFMDIDMSGFSDKNSEFIDMFFSELANKCSGCVFNGLSNYHDGNSEYLLAAIMKFSLNGKTSFIIDKKGNRAIYDAMYDIAKRTEGLNGMDVTYKYLTLPSFNEVTAELEEKGVITVKDHDFLRSKAAFMGYVGFNRIVTLYTQQKSWRDEIVLLSAKNEAQVGAYLRNLPSQAQLLDPAWRDLAISSTDIKVSKDFDYDSIRAVNTDTIKNILAKNMSLFAKCGMVVRYSLLHGDDVSVWQRLTVEEKNERLTDATRLVAHLLDTQYQPEVILVPEADWNDKAAGGLCCDGGKLIKYRESSCESYSWTVKAVCHECYHAFQHTLENFGWKSWHYEELGVTKNRVNEWMFNSANYRSIEKGKTVYLIQVFEADARTFEEDCYQQSESVYNTIDL